MHEFPKANETIAGDFNARWGNITQADPTEVERGDGTDWINNMVTERFTKGKKTNSARKSL